MATLWRELCIALRMLRRSPSVTVPTVVVLTLGIGMAIALYAVVYQSWLHPLPYPEARRLVSVLEHFPSYHLDALESPDYGEWQDTHSLGPLGAYNIDRAALIGSDDTVEIGRATISGNLLNILRVHVALGRDIGASDDQPGSSQVAILTDGFWRERFGADPRAVGASLNIDGERYSVIGVLPRGFRMPGDAGVDVLTPLALEGTYLRHGNGSAKILRGVARLRPGATMEMAIAELRTRLARSRAEEPSLYDSQVSMRVVPLEEYITGGVRTAGIVLLGAVACILLITSANVACLLIARAAGRQREMAIRIALGASRVRIARHLLLEALSISVAGIAGGLLFANLLTGLLRVLRPAALAHIQAVRINGEVLMVVLPVVLLCALAFGLAPALPLPRVRVRKALVAGELAVSLMLLVGALLLLQSFARLRSITPGFRTDQLVTMAVSSRSSDLRRELRERLQRLPGTLAVSFADALPPDEASRTSAFSRRDRPTPAAGSQNDAVIVRLVDGQFFPAMSIRLFQGRVFTPADIAGNSLVAVVNRTLADHYFAQENPIGKMVDGPPWKTVVGVVADTRNDGLRNPARPEIYLPFMEQLKSQGGGVTRNNGLNVVIRAASDPAVVARVLRRVVHEIDPSLLVNVNTMDERWSGLSAGPKFETEVLSAFALLALILASVGIYGVMSHLVLLRRKEMGIRLALGARPANIRQLVIGEALVLASGGIVFGVCGALALSRLLAGLLFQVKPQDPMTLALGSAFLLILAVAASAAPALSASREDPARILRAE